MKNLHYKHIFSVGLLLTFLITFVSINSAQTNSKSHLRKRIKKFYTLFANENYDLMWKMTSRNLKDKNDNDKKGYIENLRKLKKDGICTKINEISFSGKKAIVSMKICLISSEEDDWKCDLVKDNWVYENNNWFFDY